MQTYFRFILSLSASKNLLLFRNLFVYIMYALYNLMDTSHECLYIRYGVIYFYRIELLKIHYMVLILSVTT